MSEFIILLLYLLAAAAFGASRLPAYKSSDRSLIIVACIAAVGGAVLHGIALNAAILPSGGFRLSLGNAASIIGLELALTGLLAAMEPSLRGISSGLLILGALAAAMTGTGAVPDMTSTMAWQVQLHILISLLSYGLLTVGAIVAAYALTQESRLRGGRLSALNQFFAPLETTEKLLFGIAGVGFAGLALAILSGLTFVEDLFAQHLAHKTVLSLLALFVFGTLLAGRVFAGWRGARAIKLYLGGFVLLCVAYFGTRFILEQLLGRSWS